MRRACGGACRSRQKHKDDGGSSGASQRVDNEWICDHVCPDLVRLGLHGTLLRRADQESAILDVLEENREIAG